jgi:hypothetical protein
LTFLNVLPPPRADVMKVYHPVLQEVDVVNRKYRQKYFEEVKGRAVVICDFPLEIKVELL